MVNKTKTLYPDTVLTFGIHQGEMILELIDLDSDYLEWLDKNTHYKLSDEVKTLIKENEELPF